jgi:hypothetical protein
MIDRYGVKYSTQIPGITDRIVAKRRKADNYAYRPEMNSLAAEEKRRKTRIATGLEIAPELKEPFDRYESEVDYLTEQTYKQHKHLINPDNLKRGRTKGTHQLDHIFSKVEGFRQNIPPEVIAHPTNLRMLPISQNISKGMRCDKSKEQLFEDFFR